MSQLRRIIDGIGGNTHFSQAEVVASIEKKQEKDRLDALTRWSLNRNKSMLRTDCHTLEAEDKVSTVEGDKEIEELVRDPANIEVHVREGCLTPYTKFVYSLDPIKNSRIRRERIIPHFWRL